MLNLRYNGTTKKGKTWSEVGRDLTLRRQWTIREKKVVSFDEKYVSAKNVS